MRSTQPTGHDAGSRGQRSGPRRRAGSSAPGAAPAVEVRSLSKTYRSRRRAIPALRNVSFSLEEGETVGLLGANGAGKTTAIKSICNLVTPTAGDVRLRGRTATGHPRVSANAASAVLEGNRNIYWRLTVEENLEFFAALKGIGRSASRAHRDALVEHLELSEKRRAQARTLSRGMQQRLAVGCALVQRRPVLLLDEPTLGLDVESAHRLRHLLGDVTESGNRTVLLSSHDMAIVEALCQRVIIISRGEIVADDNVANLRRMFRARSYTVIAVGSVGSEQLEPLSDRFPSLSWTAEQHELRLSVDLEDQRDLFSIIDWIRNHDLVVNHLSRHEPNLESIYLYYVGGR